MDIRGESTNPYEHLGCGYWTEDGGYWGTDGMSLGALEMDPSTENIVMQCATYHLSAFASQQDSTTPQWNTADLLTGFSILAQVGYALQDTHLTWGIAEPARFTTDSSLY